MSARGCLFVFVFAWVFAMGASALCLGCLHPQSQTLRTDVMQCVGSLSIFLSMIARTVWTRVVSSAMSAVIDRQRALQHFGSEGVMDSLLHRFPDTVRGTLCRLKAAWLEGRDEDLRCHIYQAMRAP